MAEIEENSEEKTEGKAKAKAKTEGKTKEKKESTKDRLIRKYGMPPREKLLAKGEQALSDAELLALLLRTGTGKMDVVEFAASVLDEYGNSLFRLARTSAHELKQISGFGDDKATKIAAALEIARRVSAEKELAENEKNALEVQLKQLAEELRFKENEEIYAFYLDRKNNVISRKVLSYGGLKGAFLDVPALYRQAVRLCAHKVVLVHNHPNGIETPSREDKELTAMIRRGLSVLRIELEGHYIAANGKALRILEQ